MRLPPIVPALCLAFAAVLPAARAADSYPLTPDSQRHDGVPVGEQIKFTFDTSRIFPGTTRSVTVYVPKQYDPVKPACVYVNQDGVQWNAPVVFDNLIAAGTMPVTIGVFSTPGVVKTATPATALDRFNRSYEYDGLGDAYARFILEELLPAVESKTTADGRPIHLSHDGNDRAIGGSSSGAIAAFTAAWERPDAFTRVFTAIGTFVGLRGGNEYPTLIRKVEPKPLRVFLQDGSADQNIYGGDWWMANQEMELALTYAGYEVNHAWGTGAHSGAQGTAIFPEVMRWLWKDWPQPVKAALLKSDRVGKIVIPGEGWEELIVNQPHTPALAANARGEVFGFFSNTTFKVDLDGKVLPAPKGFGFAGGGITSAAFGPDSRLYSNFMTPAGDGIDAVEEGESRSSTIVAPNQDPKFKLFRPALVLAHNGNLYAVGGHKVLLVKPAGDITKVGDDEPAAGGLALSTDQSLLYLSEADSHWVDSYTIKPDGTLTNKQRYFWLHAPDMDDNSGAAGMCVDRGGSLYVATRMGVQVCDQAGRVNCILTLPLNATPTAVCFGGANFDTLFVACGDKVFQRKLNAHGANGWDTPTKPTPPQL
jgi:enterochelin esterase-like enzyme